MPPIDSISLRTALNRFPRAPLRAASLLLFAMLFAAQAAMASWMVPPAPDRPKDFALLKRNGLYHLFYIRNNPNLPFGETQFDFGHATSEDLYFWQHHPPVLPSRPGHFDRSHVWAPSIVQRDGIYYLFYTGVSDSADIGHQLYQRIGVATSSNLFDWNPLELPVLACEQVPWTSCDSLTSHAFRDPFVMADPTTPDRWLMYYATDLASDPGSMVAGVATSDGDFTAWQDFGPLWITHRSWSFNSVIESPHTFQHDGLWYLFFTTNSGQPISFATSPNPIAEPQNWIYRGRLGTMLGLNTFGWFASEYLRDGLIDYFAFVNGDRVEITRMNWQPQERFQLLQPDLFHVVSLNWLSPTVRVGQQATLYIQSKWWGGRTLDLECFWLDAEGGWHPIPNGEIGIPDHISLSADLQTFAWIARAIPASYGAPLSPQIVVRVVDQTCTANYLQILPQQSGGGGDPDPPPDPVGGANDGGGGEELYERGAHPILRTLRLSLYGSMANLAVDLPAEESVRIDVFDLMGRRVRQLADRRMGQGATVVGWDGRDDAGLKLSRGLYFARLTTPRAVATTRIFLR